MTDTNQEVRETPEALTFTYTNWRGETAVRRVKPDSIRFGWGSSEWHPEPQWIMSAMDLDKGRFRDFAVKDIVFASAFPNAIPLAVAHHSTWGYERIIDFFDRDETAGSFLREDGEGGFVSGLSQMAREIDRLRASAPPPAVPDAVGVRVKGLTCEERSYAPCRWITSTPVGEYRLKAVVDGHYLNFSGEVIGFYPTVEDAQAAAQADFERRILSCIEPTPSPEPQAAEEEDFEQEDPEITWRDLALQFDGQRILALQLLRVMVDEPGKWQGEAAEFVNAPPLSGEAVLAERIAALSPEPQASNVGAVELEALRAENEAYREAARAMLNNWRFGNFYTPQQPEPLYVRKFARLLKEDGRLPPPHAALSTPEPQTGEQGGEPDDLTAAYMAGFERGKDAERTAREAAETRVREQQQAMEEGDGMVAEQVTRAEAAERRIAEVEERAEALIDASSTTYRKGNGTLGTLEGDDGEMMVIVPSCEFHELRAALRAKPEAQALAGKEAVA